MTTIEKACYGLIVSAFVMGGLLIVNLQDRVTPQAQANLLLTQNSLTVMTAPTQPSQESLFVLDNISQKLLIYTLDTGRRRMGLQGSLDLAALFGNQGGGGGQAGGVPAPSRMPR